MNLKDAAIGISTLIDQKMSCYLLGPSGCGKTETMQAIADAKDMDLISVRMVERDQVDIGGLYVPDHATGTCRRYAPAEFTFTGRPKLLFFDELSSASSAVQASCYQVFNERRIGDSVMRDCDAIVAAGNRASDKGVTFRIPTPLRRRWFELQVEPDVATWSQWALEHDVSPMMCAFIRSLPHLLYDHSPDVSDQQPDPRAWVRVDKLYQEAYAKLPENIWHDLVVGKVGPGAAVEYQAFLRMTAEVPSVEEIRKAPGSFPVPSNPSILYAVSIALARTTTLANFAPTLQYLERMPAEYHSAVAMPEIARKLPKVESHPAFVRYAGKWLSSMMASA